jgi:hypothetical protein
MILMNKVTQQILWTAVLIVSAMLAVLFGTFAVAQNPELQERVTEMKQTAAKNKQALAQ